MAERGEIVGNTKMEEWLNAGQCTDCFLPSYNYRPKSSVQYSLAKTDFSDPDNPKNYRWGFIAASDVHSARPGTGYKEVLRLKNTDGNGPSEPRVAAALPGLSSNIELARFSSFLTTGGLAAVHSKDRKKHLYGTPWIIKKPMVLVAIEYYFGLICLMEIKEKCQWEVKLL